MEIKLPATVKIENKATEARVIMPYAQNFRVTIAASDSLSFDVLDNAEVVMYYLAQATDDLVVTQTAKAAA